MSYKRKSTKLTGVDELSLATQGWKTNGKWGITNQMRSIQSQCIVKRKKEYDWPKMKVPRRRSAFSLAATGAPAVTGHWSTVVCR